MGILLYEMLVLGFWNLKVGIDHPFGMYRGDGSSIRGEDDADLQECLKKGLISSISPDGSAGRGYDPDHSPDAVTAGSGGGGSSKRHRWIGLGVLVGSEGESLFQGLGLFFATSGPEPSRS
jgi:hypothetical protein